MIRKRVYVHVGPNTRYGTAAGLQGRGGLEPNPRPLASQAIGYISANTGHIYQYNTNPSIATKE